MKAVEIYNKYMDIAIEEAFNAENEVPVGAIIVDENGEIIAKAFNRKEFLNDVTAHAEIIAIKQAQEKLKSWRLDDLTIYVTLEPCPMCASAILYSRISKVVFGAYDNLYGALGSVIDMRTVINSKIEVVGGVKEEKCREILKNFFKGKRNGEQ